MHEHTLMVDGIPGIVSALTFQIQDIFYDGSFGLHQTSETNLKQLQLMNALIEAAKQCGAVVVFEQLPATELSRAVFHRSAIRVHILVTSLLVRWAIESFIVDVCRGEKRTTSDDGKKKKEGREPPVHIPSWSWRRLTTATIELNYAFQKLGDEDQELEYRPWVEDHGEDDAQVDAGIFGALMSTEVMPGVEEGDEGAVANRYRNWRVTYDSELDFDPRSYTYYFEEEDNDGGDTLKWHPCSEWATANMRILDFRAAPAGIPSHCSWFRGADWMMESLALPFEKPSVTCIRTYLSLLVSEAQLCIYNLDTMPEEQLRNFIKVRNPWKMGKPITMGLDASAPANTTDAIIYPNMDRLHGRLQRHMGAIEKAIELGRLGGGEHEHASQWQISTAISLFLQEEAPGFSPMPGRLYRETLKLQADYNRDLCLARAVTQKTRTAAMILRHTAFNSRGALGTMHRSCAHTHHQVTAMEAFGFTANQRHAGAAIIAILGSSMWSAYQKHMINYICLAGSPGGGKSYLIDFCAKCIPRPLKQNSDMLTDKAMLYSGDMFDQCHILRDEAAGQADPSQRTQVGHFNSAASNGQFVHTVCVFDPKTDDSGRVVSVGSTHNKVNAVRCFLLTAANAKPADGGRGADESRRLTFEVSPGQERAAESHRGNQILESICREQTIVTAYVGVMLSLASYGVASIPETPNDAIFAFFLQFVVRELPDYLKYVEDNRCRECLRELAHNVCRQDLIRQECFKGRDEDGIGAKILDGSPLTTTMPITPEFAAKARCWPLTGVHCVMALGHLPPATTLAARKFVSVLIKNVAFTTAGDVITPPHPDDGDYIKLKVAIGIDWKLPISIVEQCTKANIPPFYLGSIREDAATKRVYEGRPMIKIETQTASSGIRQSLLLHRKVLESGYKYPTPGQTEMINKILGASTYYDFEDQHDRYLAAEDFKELLKPNSSYDANQELTLMEMWRLGGKQCISGQDGPGGVRGRLKVGAAEVLAGNTFGARQATAGGPLHNPPDEPPYIRLKPLDGVLKVGGDFYPLLPQVALGRDITQKAHEDAKAAVINRWLVACGVKPGTVVWVGHRELASGVHKSTSNTQTVKAVTFAREIPNPGYNSPFDMYPGMEESNQDDGFGFAALVASDEPVVRYSNTSNLDEIIQNMLIRKEKARILGPSSQAADGPSSQAADGGQTPEGEEVREESPAKRLRTEDSSDGEDETQELFNDPE